MNLTHPLTSPNMQGHVGSPSSPASGRGHEEIVLSRLLRERKGPVAQQWGGEGESHHLNNNSTPGASK
jgi:hypothetical protein